MSTEHPSLFPFRPLLVDGREIPVVIDPELPLYRGVCEWNLDFEGRKTTPKRIVMREWDERVLLHEALHCLLGNNEELVRRATELYEMGWRFSGA